MKRDRKWKAIKCIFKVIYWAIIITLFFWVLASWANIVQNNDAPGMSVNIWSWNFFRVVFR